MTSQPSTENKTAASPATASESSAHQPRRLRRWLWRGLGLFCLLCVGGGVFLISPTGQQQLIRQLPNWVDGLSIGHVEGSVQQGLHLDKINYQQAGVQLALGKTTLHLDFACLWQGAACIDTVAVRDADIRIDTTQLPPKADKKREDVTEIRLPLPVALRQLRLDQVRVSVDETDIQLDHFHTGLTGEGNTLRLLPTQLSGLTLALAAPQADDFDVQSEKSMDSQEADTPIDWATLKAQLAKPRLTRQQPITLPLNVTIDEILAENIRLERKGKGAQLTPLIHFSHLALKAYNDAQRLVVERFLVNSDKGNLNGQGELTLQGEYPLSFALHADSPAFPEYQLPPGQVSVLASGELFGQTMLQADVKGIAQARLAAEVALAKANTPFSLMLDSEQFRYPLVAQKGSQSLQFEQLKVSLAGDLLDYRLQGSTAISGMNLPSSTLHIEGKGQPDAFQLNQLQLHTLGGKAILSGKTDWTDGMAWQAELNMQQLNTQSLLPEWPAVLSGGLQSSGYVGRGKQREAWSVSLREMDIHGRLFQYPLQLKGGLDVNHHHLLNVSNTRLIYGENTIALNGVLGEKSDFSAQIQAPNLNGLVPQLQASIQGVLHVKGALSAPTLQADLAARQISYPPFQVQQLTLNGEVAYDKQIQGDLSLAFNSLRSGEVSLSNTTLRLNGNEASHRLVLNTQGNPIGGQIQLTGRFDRAQQQWQGNLQQATIQTTEWGNIQANQAISLDYQHKQQRAAVGAHCWLHQHVRLCFPRPFQAGAEGRVPFEIKALDLTLLHPYLPPKTELNGVVNAQGEAAWFKQKSPELRLNLTASPIRFKQQLEGQDFPLVFRRLDMEAELKENRLRLNTQVDIEQNGEIRSELIMNDLAQKRALSGHIQLNQLHLGLLKPLLGRGDHLTGEINGRLTLGGNVQSPRLLGELRLTDLTAQSSIMPFDIIGGGVSLNFHGMHSSLTGHVRSREGELRLNGDADWHRPNAWQTRVQAQADQFLLTLPELGRVRVSPNISVKATPQALQFDGHVDIPWARIEVQSLPESAVSVSNDEVIMDGSVKNKRSISPMMLQNSRPAAQGMGVKADVSVNIGKDVRLEAYGLKTHLNGLLKVRQGSHGLGLYGQVNLHQGTFTSFGQDLIIRKGVIAFTGLPSQPTLDIEAIRNPEAMEDSSITAGVKVTGIADDIDVKVFSNPSMAQDQALSYLLSGRGLDSSDGASKNSVAAALIGMGLSKGSKTVGSVGSAFGISDLNVTTEGIGDNTKVVVSGNLNSRFNVKYGVGLFAPLTELALRYRLAPGLYAQWISGINQAVDLLYRFEFD